MSSEKCTNHENFRLSSEKCTNHENFRLSSEKCTNRKIFACQVKSARIAKFSQNFRKTFFRFSEKKSCKLFFGGYNRAHEKHIRCFSPLPLEPMEVCYGYPKRDQCKHTHRICDKHD